MHFSGSNFKDKRVYKGSFPSYLSLSILFSSLETDNFVFLRDILYVYTSKMSLLQTLYKFCTHTLFCTLLLSSLHINTQGVFSFKSYLVLAGLDQGIEHRPAD